MDRDRGFKNVYKKVEFQSGYEIPLVYKEQMTNEEEQEERGESC